MKRVFSQDVLIVIGILSAFAAVYAIAGGHDPIGTDDGSSQFALIAADKAKPAADFTLSSSTGRTVTLSQAVAKGPVVIDFWETWCGPCKMEMPMIDSTSRKYASRGVQFFGIESDATAAQINQFFSKQAVTFPTLVDTGGTVKSEYGVDAIPRVVVIDRHERLRADNMGLDPDTQSDLSGCLNSLLKEQ
jgi:thiol-disulfide isomerase/thioredoxin